jgi:two-component system, OmpR family, sensor histidine kinase RstB
LTTLLARAVIVIASAAILTVLILRVFFDNSAEATTLAILRGHAEVQAQAIAATPPAERRAKAEEISTALGYPVELEPSSGDAEPRSERRAGSLYVVAGVPGTEGQVALGPIPFGYVSRFPTAIIVALVLAVIVALLAMRPVFRRIRSLEGVAAKMRGGDFSVRADRHEGEALDGIGESLNQLADRIGQLLSDERDLLRTVAHEVRAPIARMRFRVEKIHRNATDAMRKDSSGLVSDLEQVDKLFEELLTYVAFDEFDHERPELQTETIDVMDRVRTVVDEVTATAEGITVELVGDEAQVLANTKLFDRAVTNLLLNAMAYGGPDIRVDVRNFERECIVDVQDSGPGIPELDRPKVVRPFVRLSQKKTKGTGLGLAIVSRIMRLHGGRLHLLNRPRGGASVQLAWRGASPPA